MARTKEEQKEYLRLYYAANKGRKSKLRKLHLENFVGPTLSASEGLRRGWVQRRTTYKEFKARAAKIHDGRYEYAESEDFHLQSDVAIVCPMHGTFVQRAAAHLAGRGCAKCAIGAGGAARVAIAADSFVERLKAIHGTALQFDKAVYVNWETRVEVSCPEHGAYMALPAVLLRGGKGCLPCAAKVRGPDLLTKEEFADRARHLHGDKYSYESGVYLGFAKNMEMTCKEHGSFFQTPCNHMQGKGCPKCSGSQSKAEVALLEWIRGELSGVEVLERCRSAIPPYELDIYVPSLRVAIEFNGLYWHSADKSSDGEFRNKHLQKFQRCQEAGIRLVQIREDRWVDRQEICRSIIANALHLPMRKENARDCELVEMKSIDAMNFLIENHLDGAVKASVSLGLRLDGEVLSVMTFAKPRYSVDADWELVRFASKPLVRVRGAAGKLMAAFRASNPGSVVSYCNLEYGSGGVYRAIGMKQVSQSRPGYLWAKNGQRVYSRYQTQKHKLSALLPVFDPLLSESENMFANGFRRYWDSGNFVFMTQETGED